MADVMTRAQFNALSANDRMGVIKSGTTIADPVMQEVPDPYRFTFTENGVTTTLTRRQFGELPILEQARIGRHLRIEKADVS